MVRTKSDSAFSQVLEGLAKYGEPPRVGLVGNTRVGKTTVARRLLEAILKSTTVDVVVIDAKANRRYDDVAKVVAVRESVAHLAKEPPEKGCRVVIARANVFRGQRVDVGEWQAYVWSLAGRRVRSIVFHDEAVPDMAEFGQFMGGKKDWSKLSFIQGGEHGIGQVWCTTDMDQVPVAMLAQGSHLLCFQMAGSGLAILERRNYLLGVPPNTIENLAGYEKPPEQRGEFLLLRPGVPWDGRIYR